MYVRMYVCMYVCMYMCILYVHKISLYLCTCIYYTCIHAHINRPWTLDPKTGRQKREAISTSPRARASEMR